MRRLALLIAMGALGCSAQQKSESPSRAAPERRSEAKQPIPADLRADVQRVLHIGRAIYAQDVAVAMATDVLLAGRAKPPEGVMGWVTLPTSEGWRVLFVGAPGGTLAALYEVSLEQGAQPEARQIQPAEALDAETRARYLAAQSAARHKFKPCSDRHNPVVLPAALLDEQGWLVYLLARSKRPKLLIAGGHQRFIVSADGSAVVEHRPLSKSCLELPLDDAPRGGRVASVVLTHIVQDTPSEAHVFLSLLHGIPIYVATRRGVWHVSPEGIEYAGRLADEQPVGAR